MSETPKVGSFEYWIDYLFNRPVTDPAWYWEDNDTADWLQLERNEITVVSYVTRTFENAGEVLKPFSNGQVADGLNFIIHSGASNLAVSIVNIDNQVQMEPRLKCLESIYSLYTDLFAVRCSPEPFLRRDRKKDNPLDMVCFMWWDIFPVCGGPKEPACLELGKTILKLLEKILTLDSDACRESALHGLGELSFLYPREVKEIVTTFLTENPNVEPKLRKYALNASWGNVQ